MHMSWNPFQRLFSPKKILGIDIDTSYIKVVELSKFKNKQKLENYGFVSTTDFSEKPFRTFEKNNILLSTENVIEVIKSIIQETGIKTKQVVFSIPDFSTFFTNFELPWMKNEELDQAIQYEAKQHIPLSLKEVTLDWQVISDDLTNKSKDNPVKKRKLKILLVAVPKTIINQYQEIAALTNLELISLETEAFCLTRSLIKKDEKDIVALIGIGVSSTTCSIIQDGKLENSYSFNMSSNKFDKAIAEKFNINYLEAEKLKKQCGLLHNENNEKDICQILLPLVDIILMEIQKIFDKFYQKEGREIKKIILTGGTSLLPGLKEYFQVKLKKEIIIAQPFSNFDYPPILEKTLKEIGPSYAVSVGAALRGLA